MTTSQHNLKTIDAFLSGELPKEEQLLFEAKLLLDPELKKEVGLQRYVYSLIRLFARRKIKADAEKVHARLFNSPEHAVFQHQIYNLFTKH